MNATRHAKNLLKDAFPSLWLHWHFMHRPKSAERELSYLGKVVPPDAVTVDVGANCGLYTRKLARLSRQVHAFEPSQQMARLLRRTSAANVSVHEMALSDHEGEADLFIPQGEGGLVHGLASLEPRMMSPREHVVSDHVPIARLDEVIRQDVAFVKIDVEGHELSVLNGAVGLVERCQPVFLVEAEDRHRAEATRSVFEFFRHRSYRGFFLRDDAVVAVEEFRTEDLQDAEALEADGGRKAGQCYVNNFFFFPPHLDGESILNS
ncbi:FkbM family methyltransferase [Bradyrhizobium lablabi]|uniref:FkbM family methyltransferase n=1 Tax=Bradyrhizobium lablabi TaxID=722472 RepID=UPI001BAE50EA|nr:FkbM family methyltransferase [Bradyrhizobium lablabi]MBR1119991.1 FkbM family methyltransferase [Bradyrhizobium lablabi]